MPKKLFLATCFAMLVSLQVGDAQAGIVISTFDTDADGWTTFSDATQSYSADFGNPAGSLKGTDKINGVVWYFNAPAKFLGDQSANYGAALSYDVWFSHQRPGEVNADVYIRGNGLRLNWFGPNPLAQTWTTQVILLDETGGWTRNDNHQPATEAELRSVLSNLDLLRILGETRSGPDYGFLDNVAL